MLKTAIFASRASAVTLPLALLFTGCSGGGLVREPGVTPLSASRIAAMSMAHYVPHAVHTDRSKSWIDPQAKKRTQLLYVSDWDTNDVYVYNYKTGASVGKLTGFDEPYGQCVDAKGDVFITNFGGASVVEYAHGGTKVLKTFSVTGNPLGCAIDKAGDVAVGDYYQNGGSDAGNVEVFAHGGSNAKTYTSENCYYIWGPAYDRSGNLFVESAGAQTPSPVCELPSGGSALVPVSFNVPLIYPGSPVWDGKEIALTDQEAGGYLDTGIYQTTISGSSMTEKGETLLTDTCFNTETDIVVPFVVGSKNTPVNKTLGKTVAGGNLYCVGNSADVSDWVYPAGGGVLVTFANGPVEPYGASVSSGK